MDCDPKRIDRALTILRDRVPLAYQAVTYSAEDALDELIRFEVARYEYQVTEHTNHDAPCVACFWEAEIDSLMYEAESKENPQ